VRDASAEKEAEEHRKLLTHELEHRIKNMMAVVQAIVNQTLRHAASPQEARETIGNRLQILSRAHDMLTRTSWSAAPILEIISAATQLHGTGSNRIRVQGPDIHLKARAALALSLVLHELLTNALKYGSLSNDVGIVDLNWSENGNGADARFDFEWTESGGPRVEAPTRKGFGTRLIEAGVVNDLGASTKSEYRPEGVRWSMMARLDTLKE
jgi:two-component sensor histidine kinase